MRFLTSGVIAVAPANELLELCLRPPNRRSMGSNIALPSLKSGPGPAVSVVGKREAKEPKFKGVELGFACAMPAPFLLIGVCVR
jgi:hypothetical protein